ncbi:NAD(P)-dependent oxidoreductase [Acuticoccus mangrovi]|uniref:NAD(P)-dependent oxidoreductase n=1 Tax=Acuticoccus mangrovi TaxID=2796142 RepID=A0A934MHY0_9HYPH|nr:NAD(P)-dependent oxidoreductase [Acuticoccus mangrovi]
MEHLGFVGVGLMGEGIASSAMRRGHRLTVVAHQKRAAVDRLVAAGAQEATSLEALAATVDAVAICVTDAPAVEAVVAGLGAGLRPGQMILDISTSQPATSRRLAEALADRGVRFVDAPVTGGPDDAMAGRLATLLGAGEDDAPRARALADAWSAKVRHFGAVGTGHTAKLINNFVTQGTIALLAEAYGRAHRAGVDWHGLHDVMLTGAARSGTLERIVTPALDGNFDGLPFTVRNAEKDVRYYAALAQEMDGAPSPIADALHATFSAHVDHGRGDAFVSRLLDPDVDAAANRSIDADSDAGTGRSS